MNAALATPLSDSFKLTDRVVLITGNSALTGRSYAHAVIEAGGIALLADEERDRSRAVVRELDWREKRAFALPLYPFNRDSCRLALSEALQRFGRVDVLVNGPGNVAATEQRKRSAEPSSLEDRQARLVRGFEDAFLCSQVFGAHMAQRRGGVIINAAPERLSTLDRCNLILMTRYFANYLGPDGVRVNALCRSGPFTAGTERFVERLSQLIPKGRMSREEEIRSALVFLAAEASNYMTGATLVTEDGPEEP